MKRRTFVKSLLGFFAAPFAPKLPMLEETPITVGLTKPVFTSEGFGTFGMSVRELYKADLAQWLANETDRRMLNALTGKNFKA